MHQLQADVVGHPKNPGHVPDEMTEHYSFVQLDEKRAAMEATEAKQRVGPAAENKEAA